MNNIRGIYGIRNTVNGKWYIGQSSNLEKRIRRHFSSLRGNRHYNLHLQRAFGVYEESAFEWKILEECSEDNIDDRERTWIAFYKSDQKEFGYNDQSGGHAMKRYSEESRRKMSLSHIGKISPYRGIKRSEVTRQKISEALRVLALSGRPPSHTGKKHSEETKRRISLAKKGVKVSDKERERISIMNAARRGVKRSEATRLKISQSIKGVPFSEERRLALSKSRKGKAPTEAQLENLRKMSAKIRGRPMPEEQKRLISLARMGSRNTEESKRKMSEIKKGRKHSEETKLKMSISHKKLANIMRPKNENPQPLSEVRV